MFSTVTSTVMFVVAPRSSVAVAVMLSEPSSVGMNVHVFPEFGESVTKPQFVDGGHETVTFCPTGETESMSAKSRTSSVRGDSTATVAGANNSKVGARLSTWTSIETSAVSNSSSMTRTFTLHPPLLDQFHWVTQSGASITSMRPALASISNRQSTSPPSSSKLAEASSVMFSKVDLPSSTERRATGSRPMKTVSEAWLLLRLTSSVTFSSGSTVNVSEARPTVMLAGTVQFTNTRSSAYG